MCGERERISVDRSCDCSNNPNVVVDRFSHLPLSRLGEIHAELVSHCPRYSALPSPGSSHIDNVHDAPIGGELPLRHTRDSFFGASITRRAVA